MATTRETKIFERLVQTTHSERVSPIISAVLIAGGIAMSIAGARTRLSGK